MDSFESVFHAEHSFWLQNLAEHARFVKYALSPVESGEIPRAGEFLADFERLTATLNEVQDKDYKELNVKALQSTYRFRLYLSQLLGLTLSAGVRIHLSSTVLSRMIREADEYLAILNKLEIKKIPKFSLMHHHFLWLPDLVSHAVYLAAMPGCLDACSQSNFLYFQKDFENLYQKAITLNGYAEAELPVFPALGRFNEQVTEMLFAFLSFVISLPCTGEHAAVLHTIRETRYYADILSKIIAYHAALTSPESF